jgi:hypothetical protein
MYIRILIPIVTLAFLMISCSKEKPEPEVQQTKQDKQVGALSANTAFTTMLSNLATESKSIDFEAGYYLSHPHPRLFDMSGSKEKKESLPLHYSPKGR